MSFSMLYFSSACGQGHRPGKPRPPNWGVPRSSSLLQRNRSRAVLRCSIGHAASYLGGAVNGVSLHLLGHIRILDDGLLRTSRLWWGRKKAKGSISLCRPPCRGRPGETPAYTNNYSWWPTRSPFTHHFDEWGPAGPRFKWKAGEASKWA